MYFRALVLIPALLDEDLIEIRVEEMLFPHARYFPGQPYTLPCPCTGAPWDEAAEAANQHIGTFAALGREWQALPVGQRPEWREYPPSADWQRAAYEAAKSDPDYGKPARRCEKCSGTGAWEVDWNASAPHFDHYTEYDDDGSGPHVYEYDEIPSDTNFEAIVTSDGKWHEKDWTAEDSDAAWAATSAAIFAAHPDDVAVVVYMYG